MTTKIKIGKKSDIKEGNSKIVDAAGKQIAVFNVGGNFYAISNVCSHQGGPLGEGFLSGTGVTCPWHAWEYDLKDGQCVTMPGMGVETFKVSVVGEEIFVEV